MSGRILIVDDEESEVFFLEENLAALGNGYEMETTSSGEEALNRMAIRSLDLVITNLHAPGLGGLELLARARACYPEACLILMTAHDGARRRAAARQLGARYCFVKPFPVENLTAVIRKVLAEPEAGRADVTWWLGDETTWGDRAFLGAPNSTN